MSFTLVSENESTGRSEGNYKISFRDVDKLLVESEKEAVRRISVGLDPDRFRYGPTIFLVTPVLISGKTIPNHQRATDPKGVITERDYPSQKEAYFYFREEDAAQRMAKAMVHAVELCGGGKDPF